MTIQKMRPAGRVIGWVLITLIIGVAIRLILGLWGWLDMSSKYSKMGVQVTTYQQELEAICLKSDNNAHKIRITLPDGTSTILYVFSDTNPVVNNHLYATICRLDYTQDGRAGTVYYLYDNTLMSNEMLKATPRNAEQAVFGSANNSLIARLRFDNLDDIDFWIKVLVILVEVRIFLYIALKILESIYNRRIEDGYYVTSDDSSMLDNLFTGDIATSSKDSEISSQGIAPENLDLDN